MKTPPKASLKTLKNSLTMHFGHSRQIKRSFCESKFEITIKTNMGSSICKKSEKKIKRIRQIVKKMMIVGGGDE
jgi:hypothetical protein